MKKSVQKVGMEQLRSCHGQGTSAEELQDSQISDVVIKKAQAGDLPRILEIYAYAREFMKRTGNPNQWKERAPQKEVLEADIRAGQLCRPTGKSNDWRIRPCDWKRSDLCAN